MGSDKLRESIGGLRGLRKKQSKVDLAPDTPFDAVLEERIRSLERHVDELKDRVNGLLLLVVGAVVVQVVLGLMK